MTVDYAQMSTEAQPANPFPGLRPFEFYESLLFFGRDGQSEQLIRKLSATRFLAVVGTSGSGKSSLVRAGLLPALFGGFMMSAGSNWRMAVMRPTNDPVGSLAAALSHNVYGAKDEDASLQAAMIEATLRRGSLGLVDAVRQARLHPYESVLVVVDQFEELFRFARAGGDERYQNDAAGFVKLLLEASRQKEVPIYIVLTMRSDFLGDCSIFWDLPEAINEGQYLIPRLTREQRSEAITGPVAVCGGEIAPRLVNRLLNDMGDNPDQLPILQHALMRAWDRWKEDRREDEPVDLRHYEAIGEMASALSWHADEAFNELPDDRSRKIAEKIFKALTEKGQDNREVRRPTVLKDLSALAEAGQSEVVAVIETFRKPGRSFLMPPAETPLGEDSLIDISHESLIRNWNKLEEWVEDEARSARIYRRLAETAALNQKGEAGLWKDPDLQLALNWREEVKPNNAWAERYNPEFDSAMGFLDRSVAARDAEALEVETRRRKESRRNRLLSIVFALLFLATLAALIFANNLRIKAGEAAEKDQNLRYSSDMSLAYLAFGDNYFFRAQELLDEHAGEDDEDLRGFEWYHLWWLMNRDLATLKGHTGPVNTVAFSPDGKTIASGGDNGIVRLWNLASRQELAALKGHEKAVTCLAFSPDGKTIASGSSDETVRLWDLASRREVAKITDSNIVDYENVIKYVAFSPDGKIVAFSHHSGVTLWNFESRRPVAKFKLSDLNSSSFSLAFSPDLKEAAISTPLFITIMDLSSQRIRVAFELAEPISSLAFSPDKKILAAGSSDGDLTLWEISSQERLATVKGHEYAVNSIAFSQQGNRLATASDDNTVKLWDITHNRLHRELNTFKGHLDVANSVAFSPDGSLIVTGSGDKTVRLWNAERVRSEPEDSPDVKVSSRLDKKGVSILTILDSRDADAAAALPVELVNALAVSSDGKILATAADDEIVRLWDIESGKEVAALAGHEGPVYSVEFSPDGKTLASGGYDYTMKLWEVASRKEIATLKGHGGAVRSIAFSPDGRRIATGGEDKTVRLWSAGNYKGFMSLRCEFTPLYLTFLREGDTLFGFNGYDKQYWHAATDEEVAARR
jgi:WD40 repeat protein